MFLILFLNYFILFSCKEEVVVYENINKEDMKLSYNFIIHGDWGWNSINQSLTAYEMGVYGDIINNKFVVALGDNVSLILLLHLFLHFLSSLISHLFLSLILLFLSSSLYFFLLFFLH